MMPVEEVRRIALSLPGTEEVEHWGKPSFRINKKIFTVIQEDMKNITVKITKEERDIYTSMNPETYRIPESFSNLNYMHINLETSCSRFVAYVPRSAFKSLKSLKSSNLHHSNGGYYESE